MPLPAEDYRLRERGNIGVPVARILKRVFDPPYEGDLWLPLIDGLYHSTDSGTSFTRLGTIESALLLGLGMAKPGAKYPAIYVVGTVMGVYGIFRSDDAGAGWIRINDDAHQFGSLGVIAGDPRIYGRVYLGTLGRGIVLGDIIDLRRLAH